MRQIVLDTETTGFEPSVGDEIIELACVELIDNELTGNYLQMFFRPQKSIDISAQNVHGISIFDLIKYPKFSNESIEQIKEYINGDEIIIHNAKFDLKFLEHHFSQFNQSFSNCYSKVIDTLIVAREKFPSMRNSLDALAERFEIKSINRTYHGALVDCELLALVYKELFKDQQSLLSNYATKPNSEPNDKIIFEAVK
jgi:DNA polymerase-3 subunit epsilon